MLKPQEAKTKFASTLALLLVTILWPIFSTILAAILAAAGFESIGLLGLALTFIWLGLLIWLIVKFWKIAPEVGVSPWASLWILFPFSGIFLVSMFFLEPLKYIADNKPANERLPWTWDLIKESWAAYHPSLKSTIHTSVYFLYLGLAYGVFAAFVQMFPLLEILEFFVAIGFWLGFAYIFIKLFFVVWEIEDGKSVKSKDEAVKSNFSSFIWVAVLTFLISAGPFFLILIVTGLFALFLFVPVLGGSGPEVSNLVQLLQDKAGLLLGGGLVLGILMIASWIWMIYKSMQYSQAIPALLMDGNKGMNALRESARIVKNRWWGMLWKNQLWGMVISIAMFAILMASAIIISIPVALMNSSRYAGAVNQLLNNALQGALWMLIYPLSIFFMIKLYRAFRKTAK